MSSERVPHAAGKLQENSFSGPGFLLGQFSALQNQRNSPGTGVRTLMYAALAWGQFWGMERETFSTGAGFRLLPAFHHVFNLLLFVFRYTIKTHRGSPSSSLLKEQLRTMKVTKQSSQMKTTTCHLKCQRSCCLSQKMATIRAWLLSQGA